MSRVRAPLRVAPDFQSGLHRQHQIEDDQIRQLQLRLPQTVQAVERREHLEAFTLQVRRQHFDQGTLVFDHHDLRLGHCRHDYLFS